MQDGSTDQKSHEPWPVKLRVVIWPSHQVLLVSALAIGLAGMLAYFTVHWFSVGGLVDVDEASSIHASFKVDINSAELGEIVVLPGVGPKLAQAIIDYRAENGPFESTTSLESVSGIGKKKVLSLQPFLIPIDSKK